MGTIRTLRLQGTAPYQIRKERQRLLAQVLAEYRSSRPKDEIVPPLRSLYNICEAKMIEEDMPLDVHMNVESFSKILEDLPAACKQWVKDTSCDLVYEMIRTLPEKSRLDLPDPHQVSLLKLATAFFSCCTDQIMRPSEALAHDCLVKDVATNLSDRDDPLWVVHNSRKWASPSINQKAHLAARGIVHICGLDPAKATVTEMDKANKRLKCVKCSSVKPQTIMNWREAVS